MKYAIIILRSLLGLAFVFFGLNYFAHWVQPPAPTPTEAVKHFMAAIGDSGYLAAVKGLEILGGAILLSGFFPALGLTILGPILVNIVFYDTFLQKEPNPVVLVLAGIELILIRYYWDNFAPIFQAKPAHVCSTNIGA